jgi:hypothetical protein
MVLERKVSSINLTDDSIEIKPHPVMPLVIPRSEHPISRKRIDEEALKVLYRLHRHGFLVYLARNSKRIRLRRGILFGQIVLEPRKKMPYDGISRSMAFFTAFLIFP